MVNEAKFGSPLLAPLAIFDVTGDIVARLFAFLKIDLFLFDVNENVELRSNEPEIERNGFQATRRKKHDSWLMAAGGSAADQ